MDKLGKLTDFTQNQDPQNLKELEQKLDQAKTKKYLKHLKKGYSSADCAKSYQMKKKRDNYEERDGYRRGLLGGPKQITMDTLVPSLRTRR